MRPCKRGHTEGRYKNRVCIVCTKARAVAWSAVNPVKRAASQARYGASEKGKIAQARYGASEKGKIVQARYGANEKGTTKRILSRNRARNTRQDAKDAAMIAWIDQQLAAITGRSEARA